MTVAVVAPEVIITSGNYFNDLHSAVEAGIVPRQKRHHPKAPELYALIDAHNARLEGQEVEDFDSDVVDVDAGLEVEPEAEPETEVEADTVDPLDMEIDFDAPVSVTAYVDPLDDDYILDDRVTEPEPTPEPPAIAVSVVVDIPPTEAPTQAETAPPPRRATPPKAPKAQTFAPSATTGTAGTIKPVRSGTRKHLVFEDLLLGITIADLADKYGITKTYAHDYPNMARKAGYTVTKDEAGTYRLLLPEGMTELLTC